MTDAANPYLNKPIYVQIPVPEKNKAWIEMMVSLGRRIRYYTNFEEFAAFATRKKK